jgi:hypothetical protein
MKNRDSCETELLVDLFHEGWQSGAAAGYARSAAARIRRRRFVQKSLVAATMLLASAVLWTSVISHQPIVQRNAAGGSESGKGYEVISTAELLREVRDRPLLVLNDGDRQEVVLLSSK